MGSSDSKPASSASEINHGQQIIENVAILHTDVSSTVKYLSVGFGVSIFIVLVLLVYICCRLRDQSKTLKSSIIPAYTPLQLKNVP